MRERQEGCPSIKPNMVPLSQSDYLISSLARLIISDDSAGDFTFSDDEDDVDRSVSSLELRYLCQVSALCVRGDPQRYPQVLLDWSRMLLHR